jgi:RNA polymerase sigma-70 factor (ECF subfamily)
MASDVISAEQRLLAREQAGRVLQVVEDLSNRQRTIFLLRFVDELEFCEIARATGLRANTVRVHLSRALTNVRAELGTR